MRPSRWSLPVAALALSACGGGGTQPSAAAIAVAGEYRIRKTIASDTCGLSAPGDIIENPATVRHTAGQAAFVLNDHGTRDLPGSVSADGRFDMPPLSGLVMGSIRATDTFSDGRFTASGFSLRDTTDLERSPAPDAPAGPCRVVAAWAATKQGAQNVIP